MSEHDEETEALNALVVHYFTHHPQSQSPFPSAVYALGLSSESDAFILPNEFISNQVSEAINFAAYRIIQSHPQLTSEEVSVTTPVYLSFSKLRDANNKLASDTKFYHGTVSDMRFASNQILQKFVCALREEDDDPLAVILQRKVDSPEFSIGIDRVNPYPNHPQLSELSAASVVYTPRWDDVNSGAFEEYAQQIVFEPLLYASAQCPISIVQAKARLNAFVESAPFADLLLNAGNELLNGTASPRSVRRTIRNCSVTRAEYGNRSLDNMW